MINSLQVDYEEFNESIGPIDGRTRLTGLASKSWRVDSWSIDGIDFQIMQEGGPNIYEGAISEELIVLGVGLPAPANMVVNGVALEADCITGLRPGQSTTTFCKDVGRYLIAAMPFDRFVRKVERYDPSLTQSMHTGPTVNRVSRQKLHNINAAFSRILQTGTRTHPTDEMPSQRQLGDELVHAFAEGLGDSPSKARPAGRPKLSRRHVVARLGELMGDPSHFRYSVSEMAQYAGVSERTFNSVCVERFGVGPKRLVQLRKLNDIHRALQRALPGDTVSEIASRHGVFEWGRFAANYRDLFGVSPSVTLTTSQGG